MTRILAALLVISAVHSTARAEDTRTDNAASYAIVVSEQTAADWKPVVAALQHKYPAAHVITAAKPMAALSDLRRLHPRYTCFVARSSDVSRQFVADVHRVTRQLDEDPYTDTRWGILTGYDRDNALSIAETAEPLVVRRVGSGTEVALEMCESGRWFCELNQGHAVVKAAGESAKTIEGPSDTTRELASLLTEYKSDLFVTSGHATERDWQIGFRYRNGQFKSDAGQLYGQPTDGKKFAITSDHPRIYMPIGNCLMGHIDGEDAMALAWMNSAGVKQMLGYTVPTWFGYQGWGVLDYFVEQPGRYTFNEAFFANHHALIHKLKTEHPDLLAANPPPGRATGYNEAGGLLFDRDTVAFYGDPAWQARMATAECAWNQTLIEQDGVYTFTLTPNRGAKTFAPINTNGAQRGGRPVVCWLPHRIGHVEILAGADLKPEITDDFLLIAHNGKFDTSRTYQVVFRAEPLR